MAFDSDAIALGAGTIKVADIGSPEPTDLTTAWGTGWSDIGYTEDGSEFSYEISSEPVEVAESLDPIKHRTTGRNGTVSFSMAENTVRNLAIAFNGGLIDVTATHVTYEFPEPGEEVRRMLGWESEDGTERWVWRQVFQGGSVGIGRRKGASKALLPVQFRIEKPTGLRPIKAIYDLSRQGGAVDNVV